MTTPSARAALLAGCLALAGCGVGPSYHRPALPIPAAYTSPAQPLAPPPSTAWWRGFNAPELNRLIDLARIGSPDVRAAAARIVQADQAARIAGSPLLPSLTGTAGQTWQRSGTGSEATGTTETLLTGAQGGHRYTETRIYSAELNASYEVDFWGMNLDAYRAAAELARGSRYDAQTVWLTTITSIANTYFQALGYRDRLRIAQHNLTSAASVLDAYRARLTVGTADALDVSQQEALVAGYRATLPSLESQFRQEVIALAILVGEAPEAISLGEVHLTDLTLPPVASGLPSTILRRRPDVAYAEAQLISQNQTVRQDYAAFFPSLDADRLGRPVQPDPVHHHRAGHDRGQPGQPTDPDNLRQRPEIGHAGCGEGPLAELAADYVKAVLQALSDVETGLTATSFAASQETLEAEAVRTAQQSSDIARAQLQAGTVDIVTVLNTETTLFNDQDTLAQVRVTRFLSLVSLYKALGGGWTLPGQAREGRS